MLEDKENLMAEERSFVPCKELMFGRSGGFNPEGTLTNPKEKRRATEGGGGADEQDANVRHSSLH